MAIVSSWGSNEELAAFKSALGTRFLRFREGRPPPSRARWSRTRSSSAPTRTPTPPARARSSATRAPAIPKDADLVLVWGEGFDFGLIPASAKIVYLNAWLQPENGHADVFIPVSIQTERDGHYTNFAGVVSAFSKCFAKQAGVADAEALFAALAGTAGGGA